MKTQSVISRITSWSFMLMPALLLQAESVGASEVVAPVAQATPTAVTQAVPAPAIEVRIEGDVPIAKAAKAGVHVEFRNSPKLTAAFKAALSESAAQIRDVASPDTYRLFIYGYYASKDDSGRVQVADIGRIKESLDGKGDRTGGGRANLDHGVAHEAGKLFGGTGAGYAVAIGFAAIRNLIGSSDDGAEDQYLRNRFSAKEGHNAAQLMVMLAPPGEEPGMSGTPRSGRAMLFVAKPKGKEEWASETMEAVILAAMTALKKAVAEGS